MVDEAKGQVIFTSINQTENIKKKINFSAVIFWENKKEEELLTWTFRSQPQWRDLWGKGSIFLFFTQTVFFKRRAHVRYAIFYPVGTSVTFEYTKQQWKNNRGKRRREKTRVNFLDFFFIFFSLSAAIMKPRTRIFPRQQYTLDIHIIVNDGLQSDAQGMRRGNKKENFRCLFFVLV